MSQHTLLHFKEAQDYLRVSRSTLYRLIWSGQLRGYKVGDLWRFYQDDLDKCVIPIELQPAPGQTVERLCNHTEVHLSCSACIAYEQVRMAKDES